MTLPLSDRSGGGPDAVTAADGEDAAVFVFEAWIIPSAEKEAKAAADTKTSRRDGGIAISG